MSSKRISASRLGLKVDGHDIWADASAVRLTAEVTPQTYFASKEQVLDDEKWYLEVSGIQSTQTNSLWRILHDKAFQTLPFRYAPHGNTTPDANHPHFIGTAQLAGFPTIGGQAARRGSQEFNIRLECLARPQLITS